MKKPRKDARDTAIRELILTVELLRKTCEHTEGRRSGDKDRLSAGMSLGIRVAAEYGRTYLPDYQQPAFWDEADALFLRYATPSERAPVKYKQQMMTASGSWNDLPNTDGQNRFDSEEEARADLIEMLDDVQYAVRRGFMQGEYNSDDYRIAPVTGEED